MEEGTPITLDPTLDFFAGTVAGIAALAVGHPFDTVKVRFQSSANSGRYTGTVQAITTIVRQERVKGLYKGILSPVASCAFLNGLVFASYRFFMKSQLTSDCDTPTLSQIALAGAGTGIVASVITTPVELLKIRQQSMLTPLSTRKLLVDILRTQGIKGLYRGVTPTALRDIGYGAYFFTYEATCRYFSRPAPPPAHHRSSSDLMETLDSDFHTVPWPALLLAGGLAGVAGWFSTFPLDFIKTRVQETTAGTKNAPPKTGFGSTADIVVSSWKREGPRVFWRGLSPTLIRAIPVNMVTFGAFEAVIHALS